MPTFTGLIELSRSTLVSRLMDLDTVSTNLGNYNTSGFKSERQNFQEILNSQSLRGVNALAGNYLSGSQMSQSQGALKSSTTALNMAIQGEGFFGVTLPDGTKAYTRNGEFNLSGDGRIINTSGYALDWTGAGTPLQNIEKTAVDRDGTVRVKPYGQDWRAAGQINLYRFTNPTALRSYGDNLWQATTSSGQPTAGAPLSSQNFGMVKGNYLEGSNVDLAAETTHMVILQRSFDLTTRNLKLTDDMMSQAIHMRQ